MKADEQIQKDIIQLQKVFLQTVSLATVLSEMSDPYTVGHEHRVADIAVSIGTKMGLTTEQLIGLKVCGSLHDVGKASIPSEILTKPGNISDVEYSLIKTHAQNGYEILKEVDFPWPVAQVALQHHERYDGSGYPNGLKNQDIILEARIVAVADVIESMSTNRPYREVLGIESALNEIEQGAGIIYCPIVSAVCLELFRIDGCKIS